MKPLYLLTIALFLNYTCLNAQTDISTLNAPSGVAKNGNDLYVAEIGGGRIQKFDLSKTTPTKTTIISGLSTPTGLLINGNFLYIAEYTANRISKIDITKSNPTRTTVITGLNTPSKLAISGNFLYFSEYDANRISKIDITKSSPNRITTTWIKKPRGIAINGNDLYIVQDGDLGDLVSKADIRDGVGGQRNYIVTGLNNPQGIALSGNYLFIAEHGANKISMVDITANMPTTTTDVVSVTDPWHLFADDEKIYFSKSGTVTEFEPNVLSNNDINSKSKTVYISPNPAHGYIQVFDVKDKEGYTINNVLGAEITTGSISDKQKIDISKLTNGVYFLKLENGATIKFLKE